MNFLCPACKTPLPVATPVVVACTQCGVEVDLTRVDTAPGQAKLWPEVDLTHETLGIFKLTSRAGSGGMGTVYVAEGPTGRCAVKVLSPQLAADPGLRERFRREAQALRAVQHPGVVRIVDEGTQNGFCWYAMEHVEGRDLRSRLADGPLPGAEVETLARQLLDALAAVHDAQLVHRDLKPGNILLSATGARLCDFGIARFDGATTLTESAALLGSLRYMAPEQRAGITTAKSDLYSLGLVLHEAATGGLPGEQEPPGGRLGKLIDALLQPSPQKRPLNARAAASMVALKPRKPVSTAAAVTAALLGVGAFSTWAVVAAGLAPRTSAVESANPRAPDVEAAPLDRTEQVAARAAAAPDAGQLAALAPDAGSTPTVELGTPTGTQRPARVQFSAPGATGIGKTLVNRLAAEHAAEIQECYERGLLKNPSLAGTVAFHVRFGPGRVKGRMGGILRAVVSSGKPLPTEPSEALAPSPASGTPQLGSPKSLPAVEAPRVELAATTLDSSEVTDCLLESIRRWEFPRQGDSFRLEWAFSTSDPSKSPGAIEGIRSAAKFAPAVKKPMPVTKKPGKVAKMKAPEPDAPASEAPAR